ncbi:MAG: DUF2752 domain-containing protein [Bacteroidota bacterium]
MKELKRKNRIHSKQTRRNKSDNVTPDDGAGTGSGAGLDPGAGTGTGSGNSYLVINAVLAGIIILIFLYSAFFSPGDNQYPVKCIHEQLSGQSCPSCGLSRSFSSIMRGDLQAAEEYNVYGMRVFLFFLFHLVMRLSNIVYLLGKPMHIKNLVIIDSTIAILSFILAFRQFFVFIF